MTRSRRSEERRADVQRTAEASADRWLAAAVDAGRWVMSSAILGPLGRDWPISRSSARVDFPMYGGQAGVALLLGDLAVATGEGDFVRAAHDAARNLATAADIGRFGLYSGLAGMAFAADRTARLVGDEGLGHNAEAMVDRIVDARVQVGEGVEWPAWENGQGPWQDLFHGTAGVGLALLRLGRAEVAVEAGSRLVDLAIPAAVGHWWRSRPDDTRPAPNIAHGTAGVAYSLATIALVTGRREFADAAIAGAEYLLSVARTDGDTCAVHHHEGDGSGLYTLGWCSGPPGLASLFIRLHQLTADDGWLRWAERAAQTLTTSGIPACLYPGFWDNVGQCCGSAGVAEFFLGMHSYTGDPAYLSFAATMLDDLLDRGARDGAGLSWHNVDPARTPPELPAETGYMQGAAGVGLALLHGYQAARGAYRGPSLPDSPFRP